ncbi:FtsX-like permease family protein [Novosphingobium sp. PS1R-30]|uniref:FtsX-like permease family protein n=2 Tax=Novosphingobium anseongense TaxID=3133436 RepID=A0ABU8RZJ7_9SPHN
MNGESGGGARVLSWRRLSGVGEHELVPQARLSGPMPWVIAIMVALTVIAAAAGLALHNAADATSAELRGGVTVQVVEASPEKRTRQAQAVVRRLGQMPEVESVRLVPQDELDGLIEPWLGGKAGHDDDDYEGDDAAAIPVPALIDARITGEVTEARLAAIQAALRGDAPAARVDAQSRWLKPVLDAIESLQWLAIALVALLALALAAAVLLAVRSALGANRDTIEIVHLLGATDRQVARVFQRTTGIDAAGGGLLGMALALVVLLFLARRFASLGAGMVDYGALDWFDWIVLGLVPIAAIALAMLTARLTVLRTLRKML